MMPWNLGSVAELLPAIREWRTRKNQGEDGVRFGEAVLSWFRQPTNLMQFGVYFMRPVAFHSHDHANTENWGRAASFWRLLYHMTVCSPDETEALLEILLVSYRGLEMLLCDDCALAHFGDLPRQIAEQADSE